MTELFKASFLLSVLTLTVPASGQVLCTAFVSQLDPVRGYQLELGSTFKVKFEGEGYEVFEAHFLGASRKVNGEIAGYFFFSAEKMEIHYVPRGRIDILKESDQQRLDPTLIEPAVRSINQEGGTCAAFAIFNCFHQLLASNHLGNGHIVHEMADEASRLRFYTRINNEYYADDSHLGTEDEIARELGYQISNLNATSTKAMTASLRESTQAGWPVLIRFDVGQLMAKTPYIIHNHETGEQADRRLWLPREGGKYNGGHQILILRTFADLNGKEWMLVVDSNWQAPRLWAVDELEKLKSARIDGWTVWQKGSNPETLPPPRVQPFFIEPKDLGYPASF